LAQGVKEVKNIVLDFNLKYMKIALIGYGKMGKTIEKLAAIQGHEIVLKINRENAKELTIENLKKADVAIEFSTPYAVVDNILLCLQAQVPIVIGTTAWSSHKNEIEDKCNTLNGAMLAASNFSLGVNLFFELNHKLAQLMAPYHQYKISLAEIHHTAKLDAPSGTAITLADEILSQNKAYLNWENQEKTEQDILPIHSIRLPDVPGTHEIKYTSNEDMIEIKHTAMNREGFAIGAMIAAAWIIGKKGVFTMKDVLNLT
jgi:4-hydroxy-tetrahydrodipicolinate reductase